MASELEILRQTAGMVATELGDGWEVKTDNDYMWQVILSGPDGLELGIRNANQYSGSNVTRVAIRGYLQRLLRPGEGLPYGVPVPSDITVRRDRGPGAIADQIRTRLLPGVLAVVHQLRQAQGEADVAAAARAELAERISGVPAWADPAKTSLAVAVPGGEIRINYRADSVSVDLYTCPVDVAVKLAELLREAK